MCANSHSRAILRITLLSLVAAIVLPFSHAFAQQARDCKDGFVWCYALYMQGAGDGCMPQNCVCLLEPLPNGEVVVCSSGDSFAGSLFFKYLNTGGIWRWGLGIGIGLAVINVTIGGFQIALSNGDQGKIGEGKERIMWSILGLMMLMFAGVLLNFINPLSFSQS